uniref:Sm domain-containing protein n=1 Tax=Caenorhabditis japonica TaxID=281687 RepID=A0A8R1EPT5_CAEJA
MVDDRSKDLIEPINMVERPKSDAHKAVEEYIGKKFSVYLLDGRIIEGTMIATDKDANMIFTKAAEHWESNPTQDKRYLGQAMISKKYVKSLKYCIEPPSESTSDINVV